MPRPKISDEKKAELIRLYFVKALSRDEAAKRVGVSSGGASNIIAEARRWGASKVAKKYGLEDLDVLREVAILLKREGLTIHDAKRGLTLYKKLDVLGVLDRISEFITLCESISPPGYPVKDFVASAIKLSKIERETGLGFKEALSKYEHAVAEKEKLEAKKQKQISDLKVEKGVLEEEIAKLRKERGHLKSEIEKLSDKREDLKKSCKDLELDYKQLLDLKRESAKNILLFSMAMLASKGFACFNEIKLPIKCENCQKEFVHKLSKDFIINFAGGFKEIFHFEIYISPSGLETITCPHCRSKMSIPYREIVDRLKDLSFKLAGVKRFEGGN